MLVHITIPDTIYKFKVYILMLGFTCVTGPTNFGIVIITNNENMTVVQRYQFLHQLIEPFTIISRGTWATITKKTHNNNLSPWLRLISHANTSSGISSLGAIFPRSICAVSLLFNNATLLIQLK